MASPFTCMAIILHCLARGECSRGFTLGTGLGSISLATDVQGNLLAQARYAPYGQVRWDGDTAVPTKFAFREQVSGFDNGLADKRDSPQWTSSSRLGLCHHHLTLHRHTRCNIPHGPRAGT